ncbi:MAG: winged helix-turn-helix domain-containing protein [Gammaproteobacteria bacterium]|nr:winged helix-turn-helix domain-containing protein [Gammaproteobacteria bacterium]
MSHLDPVVQIGDWYYQVIYGQLWPATVPLKTEQMVRLEPRLHSLLNFFLQHPNTLLAKDTLIEKVWPADEGTDAAVMRAVGALRKVLGDDVRAPGYIATVSKKGYCWLADIKAVPAGILQPEDTVSDTVLSLVNEAPLPPSRWPWRFISLTAAAVLLGCASVAYILASFTTAPLLKLPDTITPISALSGQEYWAVLNDAKSHAVYQHQPMDGDSFSWSLQNLADLRVNHLPQQFTGLSQPHWLDAEQILFRSSSVDNRCQFYRQQLLPQPADPVALWPCASVLPQALVRWQQQWLWLDNTADGRTLELWIATIPQQPKLLRRLTNQHWPVQHMLMRDDVLYLLVQHTQNSSMLLKLELPDGELELIRQFPYLIEQFSWWDQQQLLLSPQQHELQLYDVKNNTSQSLGPLTRELTQAQRYDNRILATQYLDYTTDIYLLEPFYDTVIAKPWQVSNRSERLVAHSDAGTAFVSDRAGISQIWLAQGRDSIQLSRLMEQQQIQQLLWHQGELLVLLNSQLYRLAPDGSELSLYPLQAKAAGRYTSCSNQLYWTERRDERWWLMTAQQQLAKPVRAGVLEVRCGPDESLLLQLADNLNLHLLEPDGIVTSLPVQLDWRYVKPEQWFSDQSGIYWLTVEGSEVQAYLWREQHITISNLPIEGRAVAIYSNGAGLGYLVRPRPHDTDIVWLQNRR